MKFGSVPTVEAGGAILAHSVTLADGRLRKGTTLGPDEVQRLAAAGIGDVVVARLEAGDLHEDAAATRIGRCLAAADLVPAKAFTGRVNLIAETPGLLRVAAARIAALNAIDEALTLATLPDLARVETGQLAATVKIIPYGLSEEVIAKGEAALGEGAMTLLPFGGGTAALFLTRTPGFRESLL